jgi:hypothetical protein
MKTIGNQEMSDYTTELQSFTTHTESVFTKDIDDMYVVYSYGTHFPIYMYDHETEMWFGNSDSYSPTTSRHQTLARPQVDGMYMVTSTDLIDIIRCGGYASYSADALMFGYRSVSDFQSTYKEA